MKKIVISLLLVICTSLLFMGCAKNAVQSSKSSNKDNQRVKSEKAELYTLAFDAVWEMDKGLNSDIKYVSINTKIFKDFSEEDKKQLFDYIADKYKVTMLDMSIDELKASGYIKDFSFKEGIVFGIDKYNSYSSNSASFDGKKWRSGKGAIGFTFKAVKKNSKWEKTKCDMTWIS